MRVEGWAVGSAVLLLLALFPLMGIFERRKPDARELVLVATMTALAVASRAAFAWLPHMKPMAAVCMISGAAFGPGLGFFVGASAALLSNAFFGQGPWTPWQMAAFGLGTALYAAIVRRTRPGRTISALIGCAIVLLFIGPLLDTFVILQTQSTLRMPVVLGFYAAGLPVNALHAGTTFVILEAIGPELLRRIRRLMVRYGAGGAQ